jgi:hypothetical protein
VAGQLKLGKGAAERNSAEATKAKSRRVPNMNTKKNAVSRRFNSNREHWVLQWAGLVQRGKGSDPHGTAGELSTGSAHRTIPVDLCSDLVEGY